MKKQTGLILGFLAAFILVISFTSAASVNITNVQNTNIVGTTGSFNFKLVSDSNGTVNLAIPDINSQYGNGVISFSYPSSVTFSNVSGTSTKDVTVDYNITDPDSYFNFFDSYSTTITLSGIASNSQDVKLSYKNFCDGVNNINNILTVDQPDFKVEMGYGDSDTWYLLDNISASVDVQNNNNNYDLRNVKVEWALYTTDGNKIESDTLDSFSLNSGDDKNVEINFQLDKSFNKIDNDGGSLYLYVKATGTIRDTNSNSDINGNKTCSFYKNPEQKYVETGDDFVIPYDIILNGNRLSDGWTLDNSLQCATKVNLAGTVYNLGNNDQSDGGYITIYNEDLGVNKVIQLGSLNGFESQTFSTSFEIPKTAQEKVYQLQFRVYDDRNHIYKNSQNEEALKNIYFKVQGNCKIADPSLNVTLDSEKVVSGQDMVLKVHLRNEDTKNATFTVSANGFGSWATLKTVDPENFILKAGETKDVYLTFGLKDSSAGDQQFNLIVTGNGDVLANKPVLVTVEEGSIFAGLFDNLNWTLWGIIILNVILLIVIIIVARRVLKRR